MRRSWAAMLLVVGLLAGGLLFALLLYPLILSQIGILISRVPAYVNELRVWAGTVIVSLQERLGSEYVDEKLRDLVSGQAGAMLAFLAGALTRIVGGGFALFNVLSLLVVTPVVAFYLLRDWPNMVMRVDGWLPRRYEGVLRAQAIEINRILAAWVRGQALCCVLLALFYATSLQAVGLDLGLIVGITAGVLSFIPYVGSITGGVTSIGLAFAQFPTWTGVAEVVAVFIAGQLLEGYVIYPRFLGDRVELHAVWVIFALFAGGAAFGFLGVLLAVPVAAVIGVLTRFWLRRYLASPLYSDPPVTDPLVPTRGQTCRFSSDGLAVIRQLALPFVLPPCYRAADFLADECNAEARAWLGADWPGGRLALWGGAGCGKTHLLHLWAERAGATWLQGPSLRGLPAMPGAGGLAIDDADAAPEEPLLHTLNAAAEARLPVLLAARAAPARWQTQLPDLDSRLRAAAAVELRAPGDAMLRALLARLLADRQLVVAEAVQDWLLLQLPRDPAALREAAARLDRAALAAGRGVTRGLAAAIVDAMVAEA